MGEPATTPAAQPCQAPPAFAWDEWYAKVGGRSIKIDEVTEILRRIREEQYPRFEGPVAETRHEFSSPEAAAAAVKEAALSFGADIVGICEIEPSDVYRGRTVTEKYAIAVGQRMRWREFQVVPSRESAIECLRVYFTLGETVIALASHIRSLGYACRVEHPIGDSDIMHVPIGLKAGFGELGRHGSIIHPKLGPLFRMGSVITSMPLAIDAPIDAGIAKFCDTCRACRKYCPAGAIPDERSPECGVDHLGHPRYVVDTGRCFPYFAKHNYCSICLPVCVYNHKEWARDFEGFQTKLFPEVRMLEAPPPVDLPEEQRHRYPKVRRP
ncbi:MAG TPA: reductive dehalogenase domain-containing protein [Vicinamibacterales bacterium]|nr:reductive dehalogenase domain-containing protein [Vicinamibacterales bacterium]